NLGIPLAPLRRARRKESVDTEWGRIGVVTKTLCAKRAADFQRVPYGTGGVGTAIESPTFSNRPQPRGRPELAGKSCFPTEVRPKLPKLPARNSPSFLHQIDRAPGTRQNCKGDLRRVAAIEVRGIHHRAILSFHVSNQVENFGISQNTGETLPNFRQKSKEILKRY
ncbi:hypothetical protein Prudu_568S000200, partial [Prunus dulcis]